MRVHELAKELSLTTKELMEVLATLKVAAKSHSSSLTVAAEERIRSHVAATRPAKCRKAVPKVPAPQPASPVPPRVDARTPTGERILGMRKFVPPPPAPAAPAEPVVSAAAETVRGPEETPPRVV